MQFYLIFFFLDPGTIDFTAKVLHKEETCPVKALRGGSDQLATDDTAEVLEKQGSCTLKSSERAGASLSHDDILERHHEERQGNPLNYLQNLL